MVILSRKGVGAVAINNLMEDAATSEISRAQLWQWLHHGVRLSNGQLFTAELFKSLHAEELDKLGGPTKGRLAQASQLLDKLVLSDEFEEFLTIPAYDLLDNQLAKLWSQAKASPWSDVFLFSTFLVGLVIPYH